MSKTISTRYRPVEHRASMPSNGGTVWMLRLSCGHVVERGHKGETMRKAQCFRCPPLGRVRE